MKYIISFVVGILILTSCGGNSLGAVPPYQVYIDPSIPYEYTDEVIRGGEVWNEHSLCPIFGFSQVLDEVCNVFIAYEELPQGVLGWAEGDRAVKINSNVPWTSNLLEAVAIHEFGHIAGLDHIEDPTCIMYPYISKEDDLELCNTEIEMFQSLTSDYCF